MFSLVSLRFLFFLFRFLCSVYFIFLGFCFWCLGCCFVVVSFGVLYLFWFLFFFVVVVVVVVVVCFPFLGLIIVFGCCFTRFLGFFVSLLAKFRLFPCLGCCCFVCCFVRCFVLVLVSVFNSSFVVCFSPLDLIVVSRISFRLLFSFCFASCVVPFFFVGFCFWCLVLLFLVSVLVPFCFRFCGCRYFPLNISCRRYLLPKRA